MTEMYTYSRTELQQMQMKHRKQQITNFIENFVCIGVLGSAREGKTQYFWTSLHQQHNGTGGLTPANQAHPQYTNEELIAALKEKFPETTVEYQETWIDVRPGVKEERKGILIDWS